MKSIYEKENELIWEAHTETFPEVSFLKHTSNSRHSSPIMSILDMYGELSKMGDIIPYILDKTTNDGFGDVDIQLFAILANKDMLDDVERISRDTKVLIDRESRLQYRDLEYINHVLENRIDFQTTPEKILRNHA